jgi:dihydrolipoamide dehydrogenase
MISELSLANRSWYDCGRYCNGNHAHPTLGEITMEAAEVVIGSPIHIVK